MTMTTTPRTFKLRKRSFGLESPSSPQPSEEPSEPIADANPNFEGIEPNAVSIEYLKLGDKTRAELQDFLQKEIDYRDKYAYSADTFLLSTVTAITGGLVHGKSKKDLADLIINYAREHVKYRASIDLRIKIAMQELARR